MTRITIVLALLTIGILTVPPTTDAQNDVRELKLPSQRVPVRPTDVRLLPADNELKDGNAAVILLRMIWEQQAFMTSVMPKMGELLELEYDDPRIRDEFPFAGFYRQLRRAAYRRDADWNYPIGEEPLAMILLPDVQGGRQFAGKGLALWIRGKIAEGKLVEAREAMLVGMANSRHYARTPFLVTQLVATRIADTMLDELELLMAQPDAPNFYWALSMLPRPMFSMQAPLQWESRMLEESVPGLSDDPPATEDTRAWRELATGLVDTLVKFGNIDRPTPAETERRLRQYISLARSELPGLTGDSELAVSEMCDEEVGVRWFMWQHARLNAQVEAAASLSPPRAIARLATLQEEMTELKKRSGLPFLGLIENPMNVYVAMHRIDRRIAELRAIEAVRDHAARNEGRLPASLEEVTALDVPVDPLTGKPFVYSATGSTFVITAPPSELLKDNPNLKTQYRIELASE